MNERVMIIRFIIIITILVLSARLFSIQILESQYKSAAENNIIQEITEYPYRGLIFDRHGRLLVHNEPVFDLMIVPKEIDFIDSAKVCELLAISHQEFMEGYQKARRYSSVLPSIFYKTMSNEHFATIQDKIVDIKGIIVRPRTVRGYDNPNLANVLGYVGEITGRQLTRDTTGYYKAGDFIGITGIEKQFESQLRGKRGVSYNIVNVQGKVMGSFRDGQYDSLSVPGSDIYLTIDLELQQYAEKLMKGKTGSIVAIDPSTGEILAFVSSPSYNPNLLTGRNFSENFSHIQSDTLKPLFTRPIQAMYPPGSMFKTIQSLTAMQERIIAPEEIILCEGGLIGDLAPPGKYDVKKAITYSSNNFFFKVFRRIIQQGFDENNFIDSRIGFERWRKHVMEFGLGQQLGIDLPNENSGSIPGINTYDRIYGTNSWKFSNIYSLSIGQGELLVTPLQMANLSAIIANKGYFYTPHIVNQIGTEKSLIYSPQFLEIDSSYFSPVIDGMEQVVSMGSGIRGHIRDIAICGKTSTVENPPYKDHSGFMGFAPKDAPKIAVAVYVENAGWGGRAAGSTASLIIEKYLRGVIKRPWVEAYVIKGDFSDEG